MTSPNHRPGLASRHFRKLAVAGLTAVAMITAACGGSTGSAGSSGSSTAQQPTDSVDNSTITMQIIDGLVPQFKDVAAAYEQAYPGRKVVVQPGPSDMDKYVQQLSANRLAGTLPDIVWNYDGLANRLAGAGVAMDIKPWLDAGKDGLSTSTFIPQFLNQYQPLKEPSAITGLPVSADAIVLFYNEDLLTKYGAGLPTASWTWEDMIAAANKVQQGSNGDVLGIDANFAYAGIYWPVLKSMGATVYDPVSNKSSIGSPEALKGWELLNAPYGTATAPYRAKPDPNGPSFTNGKAAMTLSVRAFIPNLKDSLKGVKWNVQTVPTLNGKPPTGGGSYGLTITSGSAHRNAAWAFFSWFYRLDGGMKVLQDLGQIIPPTPDGLEKGTWKNAPAPPENQTAFANAAKAAELPVYLPGSAQGVLDSAVTRAFQQVQLEKRPIADAFKEAEATVNAALAKESVPGSAAPGTS